MQIDHEAQLAILKHLLFHPQSRFSELNEFGLDNNHFNFHLKQLLKEGVIEKQGCLYRLTAIGLELAGRMDIKEVEIVRQPKLGVCLCVIDSAGRILLGKRLRDPGIGMINFYTRKVKYNESLFETAKICLREETGLEADFTYAGTIRFLNPAMDRLMIFFLAKPTGGAFVSKTKECENAWYVPKEIPNLKNIFPELLDCMAKLFSKKLFFEERHEKPTANSTL